LGIIVPLINGFLGALGGAAVGLSTGVTADEGSFTRVILVLLMFIGRLGPVVLVAAIVLRSRSNLFRLPSERPLIG
jgi:Trk-type K+ transport system membrane component